MKNKNLSLIFKIALMIFLAFILVLGNEIRIGVNRYIANTLGTDAANNARSLEKLEKVYIEDYTTSTNKMHSDSFLSVYETLMEDTSKIKCLTDSEGNILDISRTSYDNPVICLMVEDDDNKVPVYFDLSSVHMEGIESLKNYLISKTDEDIVIKIDFVGETDEQINSNTFYNIKVKRFYINNTKIYENTKVDNDTITYKGLIGYFGDIDYEMYYDELNVLNNVYHDGFDGEIVEEKVVIYDYAGMREQLERNINNDFNKFVSNHDNFMNTSYSQYYLLDLIEDPKHSHLSYSVTMCKFIDWYNLDASKAEALSDLEEEGIEGYCFIVQKYDHLYLDALTSFVSDNITTYSLTVLLLGLICLGIGYLIIMPIHRIEKAAQAISQKDFSVKLRSNRYDEIGSLARSINTMGSELEKTINNLHLEIDHTKQLEDLRKEFVSNFTHEIKTPLGIINGFSELIELEEDEKKRNEYIDIIQQEAKKINELVLAMLDLSKLESKNISLNIVDVDIVEMCEDILDNMSIHIENKKINVEKDFYECIKKLDYQKMEMVITNLISNAIRYTHDNGHIYITINEMGFYIENEGSHIPEEELSKIWLAFHKTDKSRNDQGTGLGLSIVKAALDLHNIRYGVTNTKKGVLFYFEY